MSRRWFLAALFLFALAGEGATTRVFFRKLEEVLTAQTPVALARVTSFRVEQQPEQVQVHIGVDEVEVIQLRGPAGEDLLYCYGTNLERTVNGQVIRVSPIREGSGLETDLLVGQRYCFLLDRSGQFVVRVEPESSAPAIRDLLDRAGTP